jgi:hypothetical protein
MSTRKTLIRSEAGVRLQRIERLGAQQKVVQQRFSLSTLRRHAAQTFADQAQAEDAFDLEVIAALTDPVVMDMQRRGLID